MNALLNLIPGGSLTAIGVGILAALGIVWRIFAKGQTSGRDAQIAKEAKAREQDIELIKRASGAKPSGLPDNDPRNRDRNT